MFPFPNADEKAAFQGRKVQDVWNHHNKSLASRDIDEFIKDFSDTCVFINNPLGGHSSGTFIGPAGVAKWCKEIFELFDQVSEFSVPLGAHIDGADKSAGVVMISWSISNARNTVVGGVDTFVLENGQFQIVTVVYDVAETV